MLILITFATGGSLTGLTGKKLMAFTEIENDILYLLTYILIVTLVWPFMVLAVSLPLGQFLFFKTYIGKLGSKMTRRNKKPAPPAHQHKNVNEPRSTNKPGK